MTSIRSIIYSIFAQVKIARADKINLTDLVRSVRREAQSQRVSRLETLYIKKENLRLLLTQRLEILSQMQNKKLLVESLVGLWPTQPHPRSLQLYLLLNALYARAVILHGSLDMAPKLRCCYYVLFSPEYKLMVSM